MKTSAVSACSAVNSARDVTGGSGGRVRNAPEPVWRGPATGPAGDRDRHAIQGPAIEIQIARHRGPPAEVPPHGSSDAELPFLRVLVQVERATERAGEGVQRVVLEQEPGAVVQDRVREATDPSRHGEDAVPLGSHLRQAARLVQRRHQQDVRPCEQAVLQRVVEVPLQNHARGETLAQRAHARFVALLAPAEERELHVRETLHQPCEHEIEPLLRDSRALITASGIRGLTVRPSSCCSAALHWCFPARSVAEKFWAIRASPAGSHTSQSMPFRMPTNRSPTPANASCNPKPPTGVRSSSAWFGLTVTTASA